MRGPPPWGTEDGGDAVTHLPRDFWLTLTRMASFRRASLSSKGKKSDRTLGWVGCKLVSPGVSPRQNPPRTHATPHHGVDSQCRAGTKYSRALQ